MMYSFFLDLFGIISTGLIGVWAGRCWQRAIDVEKTLDALALKYESIDNTDEEFAEVEQLLMEYAERLESPTASDLNEVLNEVTPDRSSTEPDSLRGNTKSLRDSSLSEGSPATDSHSNNREKVIRLQEEAKHPSSEEEG